MILEKRIFIILITVPVLGAFGLEHLHRGDTGLGGFLLFLALLLLASFGMMRKRPEATGIYRANIALAGTLFFYLLVRSAPTGYMGLWMFVYPPVVFYLLGGREGLICSFSLTKKLVELHRGTLCVESEGPGRGSRFCFTLPIAGGPIRRLDKTAVTE